MDNSEFDDLADVSYGLFEHFMINKLKSKETTLFDLIKDKEKFWDNFLSIFHGFNEIYPDLAQALIKKFGSKDQIYEQILNGEGVVPSKTTQMYWIIQDAPNTDPHETENEKAGKWLIFLPPELVDDMWEKIRDATYEGKLGISAKVSTSKKNPDSRDNRKVIYVYTRDWEDEDNVMQVREILRKLGVVERIGYKRNLETYRGEYSSTGKKVTYYSA